MGKHHIVIIVVALVVGYYAHSKFPGLLSKVTGGAVAA